MSELSLGGHLPSESQVDYGSSRTSRELVLSFSMLCDLS